MRLGLLTTQKTMIFKKMNVKVFVGALAMLSLAACSKNDVFDAEQVEKNKEAQAKAKMEEYYQQAIKALDAVNVAEDKKKTLRDYAAKMMKRKK